MPEERVETTQAGAEQRRAPRVEVNGLDRLAQRTLLITTGADGRRREHKCRIVEASATGYRVVLVSAQRNAGQSFKPGEEIRLEHIDGWQREVQVRWVRQNSLGLMILRAITRMVMPDGKVHECVVLSSNATLYRVETAAPVAALAGTFELELSNGRRRVVRVRWHLDGEICLQEVETRRRL